jgi:hypothetical protein
VYVASSSPLLLNLMLGAMIAYLLVVAGFFFAGRLSMFSTSWLGFVITLSFSAFLYVSRRAAVDIRTVSWCPCSHFFFFSVADS